MILISPIIRNELKVTLTLSQIASGPFMDWGVVPPLPDQNGAFQTQLTLFTFALDIHSKTLRVKPGEKPHSFTPNRPDHHGR